MPNRNGYILLAAGWMELVWLYAMLTFVFSALNWPLLPPFEIVGIFWLAALLTFLTIGRGWRIITLLAVQSAGLTAAVLRLLFAYGSWSAPFWGRSWLVVFSGVILWWAGFALARRKPTYTNLCARFDLGIGMLFFLLLMGTRVDGNSQIVKNFLMPFFLVGLLTIALARNSGGGEKRFVAGYRGAGLILTFVTFVFLAGAVVISFFLPILTTAAEAGYQVMRPFGLFFMRTIVFLFGYAPRPRLLQEPAGTAFGNAAGAQSPAVLGQASLFEKIIGWGLFGLAGFAAAVFAGWGLWHLLRLLLRPTTGRDEQPQFFNRLSTWLRNCLAWLLNLRQQLRNYLGKTDLNRYGEAEQLFRRLKKWGKSGGLSAMPWETPTEYGMRLSAKFPVVAKEIKLIVDCFNLEVYRGNSMDSSALASIRKAWKSIARTRKRLTLRKVEKHEGIEQ